MLRNMGSPLDVLLRVGELEPDTKIVQNRRRRASASGYMRRHSSPNSRPFDHWTMARSTFLSLRYAPFGTL